MCFQKVIDLDPQDPRGYLLMAATLRKMGREPEAQGVLMAARQRGVPLEH
jgi:hypothetical protein